MNFESDHVPQRGCHFVFGYPAQCVSPKSVIEAETMAYMEGEDPKGCQHCTPDLCQNSSSTKRRRRTRTKRVSFADTALVYGSDRTQDEVDRSWYNREELAVFKNERRDAVRMLKRASFDVKKVSLERCLRGFEAYFSVDINRATKHCRELVLTAVFAEQNRQWAAGIVDVESLRGASQNASRWALRNALESGSKDAATSYMLNSPVEQERITATQCGRQEEDHPSAVGTALARHSDLCVPIQTEQTTLCRRKVQRSVSFCIFPSVSTPFKRMAPVRSASFIERASNGYDHNSI